MEETTNTIKKKGRGILLFLKASVSSQIASPTMASSLRQLVLLRAV